MSISVVLVRGVLAETSMRGVDADKLLRAAGIERHRLADLRETIDREQAERLVRKAVELTGDPGLGLSIGLSMPVRTLQVLGHLLLAHSTLREAFHALYRYSSLAFDGPTWELVEQGEDATIIFRPGLPVCMPTRFLIESTLVLIMRVATHFNAGRALVREVHMQHSAPHYVDLYGAVFRCPVLFDQPSNGIVVARSTLDVPQAHADTLVRDVFRDAAERLLRERVVNASVADRVRALIRLEATSTSFDVESIARCLGMSVRTMRRRLGAEGAPLSTLIDEALCRVACVELGRPGASIKETADLLGFSEASAFHRAFKRWTGRTAAEFRHAASGKDRSSAL